MQQTNPVPLQTQDERFDRPVSGLVANPRPDLSGSQTGTRVRTVYNNETQMVRPPPGFQTVSCAYHSICVRVTNSVLETDGYMILMTGV